MSSAHTCAADAAALLGLLGRRPRVLALGEPTHGVAELLALRNDLFRDLVEHEGYRTIAVESDCVAGLLVDDHVTSGAGDLDDVVARGFSHEWGAHAGNRALVEWMRAHNQGRPAVEQVRFAGVDGPLEITTAASPRATLTALHTFLAARLDAPLLPCTAAEIDTLVGDDARWTEPAAMYDPARSVGRTPDAQALRLLADDLIDLLDAWSPGLRAASSRDEWDRARLHGRAAVGLLRYHSWMADTSPARIARLLGVRDAMMAGNVLAGADRGPVLVFAHNAHLQRDQSSMRMGGAPVSWWSAGAIVDTRLGDDYAFVHTAVGTIPAHGVAAPAGDTVEGRLSALGANRVLADPRAFDPAGPARRSPWFGYAPLDPAHLPRIDGVAFVRDCTLSSGTPAP
ncbi:erythromycin esterase family protein [Pseudonocardia sulfidoxydans]|nr:erythromycin esterase family protein [Pseudonocardia sulfidoxydans]